MTSTDVLGYLQSKGLNLKPVGASEVHMACFFCGEDPNSRGRLYVNVDPMADVPGLFKCHLCEQAGNLITLKKHFGDSATQSDVDHHTRFEIFQAAALHYHHNLADYEEAFQYLRGPERGLTVETLAQYKIGYAGQEAPLYKHLRDLKFNKSDIVSTGLVYERDGRIVESLQEMITIPYMVAGSVVTIRGRSWPWTKDSKKPKYKSLPGSDTRLFNTDHTWHSKEIICTEGEFDALALEQLGFPAVGIPGAVAWQESWDGYLSSARRIHPVFDRDVAGSRGLAKMEERFGSKVRAVHLSVEGQKLDPTDWVASGHTRKDFQDLLDEANRTGGILVTVDEAATEFEEIEATPGLKFGLEGLDTLLAPGIRPAQLMIVLAKTGTGKTLALLNMMQSMSMVKGQENAKFLFLSLEQTRGEWFDRARRLHRFYNLEDTDDDAREYWRHRMLMTDRNRLSDGEVRQAIDDFDYRMGGPPDVIFLDYLGYWARSFKGDEYQRLSDAVMGLKALAKELRIPIIAPHQVNRGTKDGERFSSDAARGSGVIEETADFVMGINSADNVVGTDASQKSGLLKMDILKSRHGGRGQCVTLQFAPLTLAMVPTESPLARFAKDELKYANDFNRDTWQMALYRHRTGFTGPISSTMVHDQGIML